MFSSVCNVLGVSGHVLDDSIDRMERIVTDDRLERLLKDSRPTPVGFTSQFTNTLERTSETARRHAAAEPPLVTVRKPVWKRPPFIFAVTATTVLAAVTGASAITMQSNMDFDAIVNIEYRTDTGKDIQCLYTVGAATNNGSGIAAAKKWIAAQDWSGVGQVAYDQALAHPYIADANDDSNPTSEQIAFRQALVDTITGMIPDAYADADGAFFGGTSDCPWTMH